MEILFGFSGIFFGFPFKFPTNFTFKVSFAEVFTVQKLHKLTPSSGKKWVILKFFTPSQVLFLTQIQICTLTQTQKKIILHKESKKFEKKIRLKFF